MSVTVRIENTYEDGHESVKEVEVPNPEEGWTDLDPWWEDEVFQHTGDGHGMDNPKLGSWYEAEIIAADMPNLVGRRYDWG